VEWNKGHLRLNLRREYLLSDSMSAVMSLSASDLRKVWRFDYIGEPGYNGPSAIAKEWFELISEQIFDPNMGFWRPSASDETRLQINSASGK
jgi:hypothetical protein